jgi:hypothetical protein
MLTKLTGFATHSCPKHDEPQSDSDMIDCASWIEGYDLFQIQSTLLRAAGFEYVDGGKAPGKIWLEVCRQEDESIDMVTLELELDKAQCN